MVSGNIYEDFLHNVIAVGKEFGQNFLGLAPHVYCKDMSVTGKK